MIQVRNAAFSALSSLLSHASYAKAIMVSAACEATQRSYQGLTPEQATAMPLRKTPPQYGVSPG